MFLFLIDFGLQVTKERGERLAVEHGIKFLETSAKTGANVEEAFLTLARDIKTKTEKKLVRSVIIFSTYNIRVFYGVFETPF